MPNEERKETTSYQLYKLDRQYKDKTNFVNFINERQNFYNGKQYPDNNVNNMIRVTMNICSMCVQTKASKICGTPIYLTFTADDPDVDCTALRQFDEYNFNKMKMDAHNYQSALNGYVNGTEIVYMPWDDDDTTYKGIYKGGISLEHIDPRNFAVANPFLSSDIQRQKWVMFWEDYDVSALLDMVEGENEKEIEFKKNLLLKGDKVDGEESYKDKELVNHELVTMYTRFFRVNGEVYFTCSTQYVDLFKYPHPLSRKVSKAAIKKIVDEYIKKQKETDEDDKRTDKVLDYNIDYEDLLMNATGGELYGDEEYQKANEKFNLYPFAVFEPFSQNRSFYGRSDISNLIPTQRAINFVLSMIAKCAENNAYNKIFAKEGALGDQIITNEPSQVVVDYSSFTNGWGIKMAESQPLPNGLMDFATNLLAMTRDVHGFSKVMDGTINNQDLSGYAVQLMVKQNNTSIEQQQLLFWRFNEDMAAIRLLYYKHYVDEARYTVSLSEPEIEEQETARRYMQAAINNGVTLETLKDVPEEEIKERLSKKTKGYRVEILKNKDIWGKNFDIAIDAEQGLADSKLAEQQTWDNLVLNNGIQNLSPTMLSLYLQAAPNISPRTKAALKNVVKNLEMSENQQLKNQLQELMQNTAQIMQYAKNLEAQNGYQSAYLKNLQAEFSSKITALNKINSGLMKQMDSLQPQQKSEGEVKSNNAKGISGSHTGVAVE